MPILENFMGLCIEFKYNNSNKSIGLGILSIQLNKYLLYRHHLFIVHNLCVLDKLLKIFYL
jgi:hypothetical protein